MGKKAKQQHRAAASYRPTPAPLPRQRETTPELTLEPDPWVVNGWASSFTSEVGDLRRQLGISQQRAFELTRARWEREFPRAWFNLKDSFLGRSED